MKILLIGRTGQVGSALCSFLPQLGDVVATDRSGLDLSNGHSIRETLRAVGPDIIVNAGAYTAVDQAEHDAAAAMAVNRDGPAMLSEEAARRGSLLVHFSTDYVFDGEKATPYLETDLPHPINAYGRGKLAGEDAIVGSSCSHLIIRTSWVYAATGTNFLRTILKRAREGKELRVVDDQRGAPTSNLMIANALPRLISCMARDSSLGGIYHMSAEGDTTWYGFARAIVSAMALNVKIEAIKSDDYPVAARRPRNSLLNNSKLAQRFGVRLGNWEAGMLDVLSQVAGSD